MSSLKNNWDLIKKFTNHSVDDIENGFVQIFPDLTNKILEDIYGSAYRRKNISIKTRHLITIGVISAMGGCDNQLQFQLEAAINLGIKPVEIREVFIQVAVFAGNARAINAAIMLHKITGNIND